VPATSDSSSKSKGIDVGNVKCGVDERNTHGVRDGSAEVIDENRGGLRVRLRILRRNSNVVFAVLVTAGHLHSSPCVKKTAMWRNVGSLPATGRIRVRPVCAPDDPLAFVAINASAIGATSG
jgi:hypothetical protein